MVALYVIAAILALFLFSLLFEVWREVTAERRFPPPGELLDLGRLAMHLCSRGEGTPTVVIDAGLGGCSLDWTRVQEQVAEFTRVCTYDRAGYGWSGRGPKPRTSDQMVFELHTLLQKAEVPPPYVLVGHSLGGLNCRLYAHRYPDEVAGLVLVDAAHADELTPRFPAAYVSGFQGQATAMKLFSLLGRVSLVRLLVALKWLPGQVKTTIEKLPARVQPAFKAFAFAPLALETQADEAAALPESYAAVRATGSLGNRPLVVLKRGIPDKLPPGTDPGLVQQVERAWGEVQAELAGLSSRGRLETVERAGHAIHIDQPGVVTGAIRRVVQLARGR